jgi:RNA polymerase sigma-70 factor (ECF subfamily)
MNFIRPNKKFDQKSDKEVLDEFIVTGDLEVLGELYSDYMHLVYGVCLKYLKNRDESKDAVMQIFEKLIIEVPKHHVDNFKSWLYVVTKNYCLMQLRSEKTLAGKSQEWMTESLIIMENATDLHPIDEDEPNIDKELENCIEKLRGEQKECILLFYFENRCYNEIALSLNLDEKKVKSHLQNAKRNLKLCLEEKHVRQE